MPVHSTTFEVGVTPEVARAWLADSGNLERWHPLYRDVSAADGGGVAATIDFYGQQIGMDVSVSDAADPGATIVVSGTSRRMRLDDRVRVEAHGAMAKVTYEVEMTAAGALRPFNRGLMPVVERGVARGAKRLAKVLVTV